jgi:hypothetical protein
MSFSERAKEDIARMLPVLVVCFILCLIGMLASCVAPPESKPVVNVPIVDGVSTTNDNEYRVDTYVDNWNENICYIAVPKNDAKLGIAISCVDNR